MYHVIIQNKREEMKAFVLMYSSTLNFPNK